jgi:hypothetical protein
MKLLASLLLIVPAVTHAQKNMSDDSLLIGTWKGSSICQVRPSPCNDEISICHVTKSEKPNTYHMVMNKIVNEKEEDMGVEDYTFDSSKKTLTTRDDKYKVTINFNVLGNRMEGTLLYQNKIYRVIKLTKVGSK